MKERIKCVRESIRGYVWNVVNDSVLAESINYSVWGSVRKTVWHPIWLSSNESLCDPIWNAFNASIGCDY